MTQASFDVGYVGPNQASSFTLSTGTYSLSSRTNVPYVALVGRSGFKKIFSWGEVVEIPKREMCTVKNESFHGGDIFINAGCDDNTRPARITVPVTVALKTIAGEQFWAAEYPADVRLARRAYYMIDAIIDAVGPTIVAIVGKRSDGSHNTGNQITFEPGSGYQEEFSLTPGLEVGPIPLGKRSSYGIVDSRPMALLTTALPFIGVLNFIPDDPNGLGPNAYYVMEY